MPEPRQVAIFANPYSGTGANRRKVSDFQDALGSRGIESRLFWGLAERAEVLNDPGVGEAYRCVVSAGGDGSMAAVVNDLAAGGDTTRVPIAMLPMGNENLFAKEFGYGRGAARLAQAVDRCATRTIDIGDAGGRIFTLMASVGFDAKVVAYVDAWRRSGDGLKRVNRMSYGPKILSAIRDYRYPRITLEAEGRRVEGAHAFIFNIGRYGGGLGIGRHADPADGQLDWVVFERPGLLRLAQYGLWTYLRRHLKRKDVHHGRASSITLSGPQDTEPLPIQVDGDPGGATPMHITTRHDAMRIVVA
ncbi:MAG: diacylglycerol kinase family protein [Planctomycetota bacterium]